MCKAVLPEDFFSFVVQGQLQQHAPCRNASAPVTLLGSSESAETESLMKYTAPGKTSSGLLAEMQANALQRIRGKHPSLADTITATLLIERLPF